MSKEPVSTETHTAHALLEWVLEKFTTNPDDYFEWSRTRAEIGDYDAAGDLLHGFCLYYEQRKAIPKPILDHLYLAFSAYFSSHESKKLEKLLGLSRPAHRKRGTGVDPVPIVAFLYLVIKRDCLTKQVALKTVAERYHVTTRTIERYDKEFNQIRDLTVPALEQLARPTVRSSRDKK